VTTPRDGEIGTKRARTTERCYFAIVGARVLRSLVALTTVAPFVALLLTGCSVVTSLDGLTGGAGEIDPTSDGASPPAADADPTDPASDATTVAPGTDATAVDPGTDATTSADGGVTPYPPDAEADAKADAGIADAHPDSAIRDSSAPLDSSRAVDSSAPDTGNGETLLFSDDFDTSGALPRGWDTIATDDGTLTLDTSVSVSAPKSLRAAIVGLAAGAAGNAANVTLRKRFTMPAAGETVAYDFDAIVSTYDEANSANVVLGALQIADAWNDLYELQIDVVLDGGAFKVVFAEFTGFGDGGSSYVAHPVSATFPIDTWTGVEIELTNSQPPLAQLYFGSTLVLETTIAVPITGNAIQTCIGLSYSSAPSNAWVINYDNAAFWKLP
jgi:hypothetical protein